MKLIIGLTGQIASGKGTAAKYLAEKHKASILKFSDILRDILKTLEISESRENIQKISTAVRQAFGEDVLAEVIAKQALKITSPIIVIDGIRRLEDIKHLSLDPAFRLVAIEADIRKRYGRITKRDENTDDRQKTFEEFVKDHGYETELTIKDVEDSAEIRVNNDGSLDDLYSQLDSLIRP